MCTSLSLHIRVYMNDHVLCTHLRVYMLPRYARRQHCHLRLQIHMRTLTLTWLHARPCTCLHACMLTSVRILLGFIITYSCAYLRTYILPLERTHICMHTAKCVCTYVSYPCLQTPHAEELEASVWKQADKCWTLCIGTCACKCKPL